MLGGVKHNRGRVSQATENSRFQSLYGASPLVCSILWAKIVYFGGFDPSCQPKHLLWSFLFMNCYLAENVLAVLLGADERTIRMWVWYIIDALNDLEEEVVS